MAPMHTGFSSHSTLMFIFSLLFRMTWQWMVRWGIFSVTVFKVFNVLNFLRLLYNFTVTTWILSTTVQRDCYLSNGWYLVCWCTYTTRRRISSNSFRDRLSNEYGFSFQFRTIRINTQFYGGIEHKRIERVESISDGYLACEIFFM